MRHVIRTTDWSVANVDKLTYAGNLESLAEARTALERLIGQSADWSRIDQFLISYVVDPALAASVFASSFASALELVREGLAEIHQKESFAPIYMRKRVGAIAIATTHDAQENS